MSTTTTASGPRARRPRDRYRVAKTLAPDDRGARRLAEHYGDALVCVRYRTDARGKVRHVTVELLVESLPIRPRNFKVVSLRIEPRQRSLHAMVEAAGGRWDGRRGVWRVQRRVVGLLRLTDWIVED